MAAGMRAFSGDELLGLPVRLHGVQLARPTDLLLDREALRAVGLDVLCGDEVHRFLPMPTATVSDSEISIPSPLVLLEEDELAFYRSRALALSSLRGRPVERDGRKLGSLRDVVVGADRVLVAVVVESDGETKRVPFDDKLRFDPKARTAA
jgi:hypothetical protein